MASVIENKIQGIFKNNDIHYDYGVTSETECEINIEWGDWKHDHLYIDYLMQQNGFKKVDEEITEEDGGDCFSSVHYYKLTK